MFESGYNSKKINTYEKWVGKSCWRDGMKKEDNFGKLIKAIYKDVRKATREEQRRHADWVCEIGTIDVKAIKGVTRRGKRDSGIIWVEFKNCYGCHGWLYGKQDFIAFEQPDCYIMVRRRDLCELSEMLCNLNDIVTRPSEALYKGYTRKNNRDLISMIKTEDLLTLQHRKIQK